MKIGDKFSKGYFMLEKKDWNGIFLLFESVTNLYEIDALDEKIYEGLEKYVRNVKMEGDNTEANQWIRILLLDSRYAGLLLQPGDLLTNLTEFLNKFPEIPDDIVTDMFMEGMISKVKYTDNSFFYVEKDSLKHQSFLVRRQDGVTAPVDFDVDDFHVNRQEKLIEYVYTRGIKETMAVDYSGCNKKQI